MEEQASSQRRQQMLTGAKIIGGLAGALALRWIAKRNESIGASVTASPATSEHHNDPERPGQFQPGWNGASLGVYSEFNNEPGGVYSERVETQTARHKQKPMYNTKYMDQKPKRPVKPMDPLKEMARGRQEIGLANDMYKMPRGTGPFGSGG
jgi:hypothetical protein